MTHIWERRVLRARATELLTDPYAQRGDFLLFINKRRSAIAMLSEEHWLRHELTRLAGPGPGPRLNARLLPDVVEHVRPRSDVARLQDVLEVAVEAGDGVLVDMLIGIYRERVTPEANRNYLLERAGELDHEDVFFRLLQYRVVWWNAHEVEDDVILRNPRISLAIRRRAIPLLFAAEANLQPLPQLDPLDILIDVMDEMEEAEEEKEERQREAMEAEEESEEEEEEEEPFIPQTQPDWDDSYWGSPGWDNDFAAKTLAWEDTRIANYVA